MRVFKWGISLTLPTSYWYLRWFDVENLSKHVDWFNLMSYDLHGKWDSPETQIGSYVYAHTNLTEIADALDLLWRNNVPANKVNLGIGFYGRSYQLEDPRCTLPGCPFKDGGKEGACTGESGVLSYNEISAIADTYDIKPVRDDKAAAMYFAWGKDQWVSYDNARTIKEKVDFANKRGLLGLFIWALDLDNDNYDALDALLDTKGGLGAFREQNGVGPADSTDWQPVDGSCYLSECGGAARCDGEFTNVGQAVGCEDKYERRWVCCPRKKAPDPNTCEWRASLDSWFGSISADCTSNCRSDEVLIAQSKWYPDEKDEVKQKKCLSGYAKYCCDTRKDAREACGMMDDVCIEIEDGKPKLTDPCRFIGREFATYSQDTCPEGSWRPWCCDAGYDSSVCKWQGPGSDQDSDECKNSKNCPVNQVNMGVSEKGGGDNCAHYNWVPGFGLGGPTWFPRALCCPAGDQVIYDETSPVPLAWLFIDDVPESDVQSFEMDVQADIGDNQDPNENAFGWVIMTGPEEEVTSLDKRDGSHWELFDCPHRDNMTEDDRATVRAVCSDDSADSNCHTIFLGGVARTVVEMPASCGIGRYAMAVSMVSSGDQELPEDLRKRLIKRGSNLKRAPHVYDFTFDYDFSVLHGRDDSKVQIRIDYSSDPGYWKAIVDNDPKNDPDEPKNRKRKRDIEIEVEREHGGSWKRYAEHSFRKERRETPRHSIHEFNKRWWGTDLIDWMDAMEYVNEQEFN